eukprot:5310857-Pleurochrysis_carterae.AAC.1
MHRHASEAVDASFGGSPRGTFNLKKRLPNNLAAILGHWRTSRAFRGLLGRLARSRLGQGNGSPGPESNITFLSDIAEHLAKYAGTQQCISPRLNHCAVHGSGNRNSQSNSA